jgi:hypothetical protein
VYHGSQQPPQLFVLLHHAERYIHGATPGCGWQQQWQRQRQHTGMRLGCSGLHNSWCTQAGYSLCDQRHSMRVHACNTRWHMKRALRRDAWNRCGRGLCGMLFAACNTHMLQQSPYQQH